MLPRSTPPAPRSSCVRVYLLCSHTLAVVGECVRPQWTVEQFEATQNPTFGGMAIMDRIPADGRYRLTQSTLDVSCACLAFAALSRFACAWLFAFARSCSRRPPPQLGSTLTLAPQLTDDWCRECSHHERHWKDPAAQGIHARAPIQPWWCVVTVVRDLSAQAAQAQGVMCHVCLLLLMHPSLSVNN